MAQHDILVRSLKKVAEDAEDENGGWKIPLIIFVRGTSGSVQAQTLNDNLKELQVIESNRNAIRKGLVYEFNPFVSPVEKGSKNPSEVRGMLTLQPRALSHTCHNSIEHCRRVLCADSE